MKITTKNQMNTLLYQNEFGNHFPWMPFRDWLMTPFSYERMCYSARLGSKPGSPWVFNQIGARTFMEKIVESRVPESDIWVLERPIDLHCLLNAEVTRDEHGLDLYFSSIPDMIMREALEAGGQTVTGLRAKAVIEHYCDPSSVEDLYAVLDKYPGCVVEFSVFKEDVGIIPHRNTIVWEVRHY